MKTLNEQDRRFLRLVQKAIFTNPFSGEWLQATTALLPAAEGSGSIGKTSLEILENSVSDHFLSLAEGGISSCRDLSREDKKLYTYGVQFLLFHRFTPLLDEHIRQQLAAGAEPVAFAQAKTILEALLGFGLGHDAACHTLALFFQMRRAFYFIDGVKGSSRCMEDLRRDLWRLIFTDDISLYERYLWDRMEDFSTLILGETGTGKGVAARAIGNSGFIPYDHRSGKFRLSFTAGFIPYNLSQISPHLVESELFGHKKGSFTGAISGHVGVFGRCSPHGAIFLDEIGEISIPIQIKLLQILQERIFSPVGSQDSQRFSGRVIAATNRNVEKMRREKVFRDDFYYRLCTESIRIPSLARRISEDQEELGLLVNVVLQKILGTKDGGMAQKITASIKKLSPPEYQWPGNVRELEQCVRRVLLKGSCNFETPRQREGLLDSSLQIPAAELLRQYCQTLYSRYGTYEAVARITQLDRRTVKRYVD
jgi:hypothetical protein